MRTIPAWFLWSVLELRMVIRVGVSAADLAIMIGVFRSSSPFFDAIYPLN
jgi:hypothetical protein